MPIAEDAPLIMTEGEVEFAEVEFDKLFNENCVFGNVEFELSDLAFAIEREV